MLLLATNKIGGSGHAVPGAGAGFKGLVVRPPGKLIFLMNNYSKSFI